MACVYSTGCLASFLLQNCVSLTFPFLVNDDDDERVGEISRCTNRQLRLVTVTGALDPSRSDGIVQMCVNGIWKPLCHDDTINDSTYWQIGAVICNQLGLGEQCKYTIYVCVCVLCGGNVIVP